MNPAARSGLLPVLLAIGVFACRSQEPVEVTRRTIVVPVVGLELQIPAGWTVDPQNELESPDDGGLALRLISTAAVSGSPRIDVILDSATQDGTILEDLIRRSLEDMTEFEKSGAIDIHHTQRKEIRIGPRRAYRVSHDYTLETDAGPIALSQLATLFVLDGRGIAVTAGGRTELFHPQSSIIDEVLSTMRVVMAPPGVKPASADDPKSLQVRERAKQLVQPMVIDE